MGTAFAVIATLTWMIGRRYKEGARDIFPALLPRNMTKRTALIVLVLVAGLGAVACSSDRSPTAPRVVFDNDSSLLAAVKMVKVDICHLTGNGSYNKIEDQRQRVAGAPVARRPLPRYGAAQQRL